MQDDTLPLTVENGSTGGRVTLKALFVGFLKVSICGFGGGLGLGIGSATCRGSATSAADLLR
ncbi:MAG: hypothetical protein JO320_04810 [Alphaproteobacteria bacterium]|nr:hypothetical protein [Alphaproteobacteria bacterium]MBV9374368.1 hypothetical protein [Alphaproteobacteria bacterium]